MTAFGGVLPAVVTPVDAAGRFQPAAFERLLARLYAAGVNGVYVCGSTGEGLQQPRAQRESVAAAAVAASPPGKQVIVHVGAAALDDARALARHAASAGAAAISSLPPPGALTFPELRHYYAALAGETPLPLFVYYFPAAGGPRLELDQLLELCALPGVAGIKMTDFDLYRLRLVKQSGATVFCGRDEVLVAGLLMGADGGIGTFYNLVPEVVVGLRDCAAAGDWEGARARQDRVNTLVRALAGLPLFPAVKQLLAWSGIDCGPCLPPREPLTPAQQETLRARIRGAGLEAVGLPEVSA